MKAPASLVVVSEGRMKPQSTAGAPRVNSERRDRLVVSIRNFNVAVSAYLAAVALRQASEQRRSSDLQDVDEVCG
jgi:hypothetical protein